MNTREFVEACKRERDDLFNEYARLDSQSDVAIRLNSVGLNPDQRSAVLSALDSAITDSFYTLLLGLAGATSLGSIQQAYRITDDDGKLVSESADGDLESIAYDIFQAN